jgi:hypothetical protein
LGFGLKSKGKSQAINPAFGAPLTGERNFIDKEG